MKPYREKRVEVKLTSTLCIDGLMFEGLVANISKHGLKVTNLPMSFDANEKKISAIIGTPKGNFKMDVRSTWVKKSEYSQEVGFEIQSFGDKWTQLLNRIIDSVESKNESVMNWTTQVVQWHHHKPGCGALVHDELKQVDLTW